MSSPETSRPAPPQNVKQKFNPTKSARDMFLSLAVIFVPILVITWLFTNNLEDYPVQAVDPAPVLERAEAEAPYEVLAPVNLPTGDGEWTVTQVSWVAEGEPTRDTQGLSATNDWLFGALDPQQMYYAVKQTDGSARGLINDVSREGFEDGTSTVGGVEWDRYVSPDDRTRALVLEQDGVTTAVAGDVSYEGLEAFASTLE